MAFLSKLFTKSARLPAHSGVSRGGAWFSLVQEPYMGAWQENREITTESMQVFFAVFACASKIAQDVAKLPLQVKVQRKGVWANRDDLARFQWLVKPNRYQTMQQFMECWMLSKLFYGNSYIYLQRDVSGGIKAMHLLNPRQVKPLIGDDGSVWYQIGQDNLSQLNDSSLTLPESEILHDRWHCFYHPLVGLSPIIACGLAAQNGIRIQENSSAFFANKSMPSGILTAPGHIDAEKAKALRDAWNENYTGKNAGKTAIIGDGMTYQSISMSAADSQLIEQLRLSAEIVCSAFKMPPFLIGFGSLPAGMKVSDLNELYYSGCLQAMIEAVENLLSREVGNAKIEFDLQSLIRMDAHSQMQILAEGVKASVLTINEAREQQDLPPVDGGDTPYMQQQNFSLAALAKRDAADNPFDSRLPAQEA